MTFWMTDRPADWLIIPTDWQTDWVTLYWITERWLTCLHVHADWSTEWWADWLIDWLTCLRELAEWLTDWLTDWLIPDWLTCLNVCVLANWLIAVDWLTGLLTWTCWMTNWLIGWLTCLSKLAEWLTDWLTDCVTDRLINWQSENWLPDWLAHCLTYWLNRLVDILEKWKINIWLREILGFLKLELFDKELPLKYWLTDWLVTSETLDWASEK